MALSDYNVKYRLEYSDVETLGKFKLEILKDSYAGSVILLTGQGNPVTIEWLRNDDIEVPIMGSIADLNLTQVDGIDLSELYTPDDEEFLVRFYDHDGSQYNLFWTGFIVQDEYIEIVNCEPFDVNVKASDIIASMGEDSIGDASFVGLDTMINPFEIIKACIDQTGLEFDFIDASDFKREDIANYTTSSVFEQVEFHSSRLLQSQRDLTKWVSYKDALESVLKSFNCKLIQDRGVLYAINIMTLNYPSTVFQTKIHTYDYSAGTWAHGTWSRTALDLPTDIQPMEKSLIRRHTPLVQEYTRSYNCEARNLIYNGGFEVGSGAAGWTNAGGTIDTDNFNEGSQSIKFTATNVSDGSFNGASEATKNTTYRILEASTDPASVGSHDIKFYEESLLIVTLSFSYFIDEDRDDFDVRYSIEKEGTSEYFDVDNISQEGVAFPVSGFRNKEINTDRVKEWNTETVRLQLSLTSVTPTDLEALIIRIHSTNGPSSTTDIYFDSFILTAEPRKPILLDTKFNLTSSFFNLKSSVPSDNVKSTKNQDLLFGFTDLATSNVVFATDELKGKINGAYYKPNTNEVVKFDYFPKEVDPLYQSRYLEDWCMDQLSALYGSPIKRYSASLKRITRSISPLDVINVDYSTYTETQLQGITYLRFVTKENRIEIDTFSMSLLPNASALLNVVTKEFSDSKGF